MGSTFLGIDLGVTEVKVVLTDMEHARLADSVVRLTRTAPMPRWSEQSPEEWWHATLEAIAKVKADAPVAFSRLRSIGVSGQTQGAVLLDKHHRLLRPAILWNDGRARAECVELEALVTNSRDISGNMALPAFTAPKLLWLQKYEPSVFHNIAKVLMPKDYIVFRLTGELVTDMSDASGTLCFDVARRDWSDRLLAAVGLTREQLPRLAEGPEPAGALRTALGDMWGLDGAVTVVAGTGRPAGIAVGLGAVKEGLAYLSLGPSGLVFVTTGGPRPSPERALRSFAHSVSDTWFQLGVVPSGTASLDWWARMLGSEDRSFLIAEASESDMLDAPIFLPYLNGASTPHSDARASGVFFGLTEQTDPRSLAYALLEGVAFNVADSVAAVKETGTLIRRASLIGEGARSRFWSELLVTTCNMPLELIADHHQAAAFGSAALARVGVTGEPIAEVVAPPAVSETLYPREDWREILDLRHARFRRLYRSLKSEFAIQEPVP